MTDETARRAFDAIERSGPALTPLREELYRAASRYADLRVRWRLADLEGRQGLDQSRRLAHDRFIDACNALSRAMAQRGLDNGWRRELGDDRQELGDFACLLHCLLGLEAR